MLKSYLEFAQAKVFGVLASPPSNVVFDKTGKLGITGALECVNVWNLRLGTLEYSLAESTSKREAIVTVIRLSPSGVLLAVGYSSGNIIVWNLEKREREMKFSGHKSGISALNFDCNGSYLVSGSKDTDIAVWDVIGERGLFKLRGHKNAITQVTFLNKTKALVSSSKDQLVKIWDLDTKHCIQTIVGHSSEIWDFAVNLEETRMISICNDNQVRVYKILQPDQIKEQEESLKQEKNKPVGSIMGSKSFVRVDSEVSSNPVEDQALDQEHNPFKRIAFWGLLKRQNTEPPSGILFSDDGTLFGIRTSSKVVEFFNVHNSEEIAKKQARRRKRAREKAKKMMVAKGNSENEAEKGNKMEKEELTDDTILLPKPSDEFSFKQVLRTENKILSFDFLPRTRGKEVVVAFVDNSLHLYRRKRKVMDPISSISLPGHRSDIRCCSLSSHDEMLMTTSSTELKIWNVTTCNCVRTIPTGYGIVGIFAPGDRHVILGTKKGDVQLFDLHSGTCVQTNSTVHTQSIFAVDTVPDKTGFITASSDKILAFWTFQLVTEKHVGGESVGIVSRQLKFESSKTVEMPAGIFCARYSKDGKYLVLGLMDNTVRVYFADSLKFFLALYGHKLPVMSLDISSDSTLVVTGSADKNVRIWGLDFGDCHRSLFAHDDTVMQVAFVPDTHYFFTAGKDAMVKYWDGGTNCSFWLSPYFPFIYLLLFFSRE
eukprot:TRINITY_DN5394_c0_g1_i7.p1 TRINITY_DN5394_c0_g1~~TRINITY_DN5394_c0_g1_i7.p1  ORF type:complete len:712 (+),score=151.18 TRINITY_DN5394_c0_g1_i7:71-2206(+)